MNAGFSQEEIRRIVQSPQAQLLIRQLQAADSAVLQQATDCIRGGNYEKASALLKTVMDTPEKQQLLRELQKSLG